MAKALKNDINREAIDYEINRLLATHLFWEFCLFYDLPFFTERRFLDEVAELFQWIFDEFVAGRPRRGAVMMPPRAGKSYITSLFCAWFLGKLPELSVMRNACTATLYMKFSYDVRKIIKSEKYRAVFPNAVLSPDKQNIAGWNLTTAKQVSYFGAGVGGTIIGFGANIALTDDLYSGMEDALSENYNERVHMWKESDHDSRKERNCPEIFIGTRWTQRDVIGKALEAGKIDRYVRISALLDVERDKAATIIGGRSFCENVKTTAEYLEIAKDTEESIFEAEYQQEPIEAKGLLFPRSGLKFYDRQQVDLSRVEFKFLYVDPADQGGDDLSAPLLYLVDDRIYLTRALYNKDGTDVNEPEIVDMLTQERVNACQVEGNSAWVLLGRSIRDKVQERYEDCDIRIIKNTSNKHTRILANASFIRNHMYFPADYDKDRQLRAFMKNLTSYLKEGGAKHDDAPDSLAGVSAYFKANFSHLW